MASSKVEREEAENQLKYDLKKFYDGPFIEWCGDLSSQGILEPEEVKVKLWPENVINNSKEYRSEPTYRQFSINLPYGRSPMVLLQAVLSKTLCQNFLQDPHFLIEGTETSYNSTESRVKGLAYETSAVDDGGVDRRIEMVESLDNFISRNPNLATKKAKEFIQKFNFLLKQEVIEQDIQDLANIFLEFGRLALRLWKNYADIKVHLLPEFAEKRFNAGSPLMEADVIRSQPFPKFMNDLPIGVIIRPLIKSVPLKQGDEATKDIVLLKAVVYTPDFTSNNDEICDGSHYSFV